MAGGPLGERLNGKLTNVNGLLSDGVVAGVDCEIATLEEHDLSEGVVGELFQDGEQYAVYFEHVAGEFAEGTDPARVGGLGDHHETVLKVEALVVVAEDAARGQLQLLGGEGAGERDFDDLAGDAVLAVGEDVAGVEEALALLEGADGGVAELGHQGLDLLVLDQEEAYQVRLQLNPHVLELLRRQLLRHGHFVLLGQQLLPVDVEGLVFAVLQRALPVQRVELLHRHPVHANLGVVGEEHEVLRAFLYPEAAHLQPMLEGQVLLAQVNAELVLPLPLAQKTQEESLAHGFVRQQHLQVAHRTVLDLFLALHAVEVVGVVAVRAVEAVRNHFLLARAHSAPAYVLHVVYLAPVVGGQLLRLRPRAPRFLAAVVFARNAPLGVQGHLCLLFF